MNMNQSKAQWCRVAVKGEPVLGRIEGDVIVLYDGELFDNPSAREEHIPLAEAEWLPPCEPRQFLGLWNNFHERQQAEGTLVPDFPLYFVKLPGSIGAHRHVIPVPDDDSHVIKFEAELGIVIGRQCFRPSASEIEAAIFGYTCVNDVTAGHVLFSNPEFPQWSRAKSWPGFGPLGPTITTGVQPDDLRVRAILDGEIRQEYPASGMIFPPRDIVGHIASEIPLFPGDVIACGTSVGAVPVQPGQDIVIDIPGIGRLENRFG